MAHKFKAFIAATLCLATISMAHAAESTDGTYCNSTVGMASDTKQVVIGGKASLEDEKARFKRSYDNVLSSGKFFSTPWTSGKKALPVELSYKFDKATVDYIIYHPRIGNSKNGNFGEVEVYIATGKSSTPKLYKTVDLKGSSTPSIITLDESVKGVSEVLFKVKSSAGESEGFVVCTEMEFFAKNKKSYDPSKLFANIICTELQPNVTLKDIERCPEEFYRTLALAIYNKKYDSEFRVAKFKAWKHPDIESKERRTGTYSLLDNPTGMLVEAGQEFALFVSEEADNENISLRVIDLYNGADETDGYNQSETFPLCSGLNRLNPTLTGLAYVIYHDETPEKRPMVEMNFATGKVNGYYDSSRHTPKDWKRLIDGASHIHFDMVGKFAHITFPTDSIRVRSGEDGPEILDFYDTMVRMEQEFMGFGEGRYYPYYSNRLYMYVGYRPSMFMYATSFRTCYNVKTMKNILTLDIVKKGSWGASHEMGHIHQTRPLMKWIGMAEVTNNIMSLYIQSEMLKQPTHLTTNNRYEQVKEKRGDGDPLAFVEYTIWEQLTMFWQLYLYNTKVLGNKNFYADIYQAARTNEIPMDDHGRTDNGACQVRFARWACDAAKLDLTEFFEYWGVFTPVSKEVKDYGKAMLTVTEEEVAATKEYIRSKNYPKPDAKSPIWFLTDDNYESYK